MPLLPEVEQSILEDLFRFDQTGQRYLLHLRHLIKIGILPHFIQTTFSLLITQQGEVTSENKTNPEFVEEISTLLFATGIGEVFLYKLAELIDRLQIEDKHFVITALSSLISALTTTLNIEQQFQHTFLLCFEEQLQTHQETMSDEFRNRLVDNFESLHFLLNREFFDIPSLSSVILLESLDFIIYGIHEVRNEMTPNLEVKDAINRMYVLEKDYLVLLHEMQEDADPVNYRQRSTEFITLYGKKFQ